MTTGTSKPITRDELRSLMRQFAQSLVRETGQPAADREGRRNLVPAIATYVQGIMSDARTPRIEDSSE